MKTTKEAIEKEEAENRPDASRANHEKQDFSGLVSLVEEEINKEINKAIVTASDKPKATKTKVRDFPPIRKLHPLSTYPDITSGQKVGIGDPITFRSEKPRIVFLSYKAEDAERIAKSLADHYGVKVEIVDSIEEFYAPKNIARTFKENTFFLCRNKLAETTAATSYLLQVMDAKANIIDGETLSGRVDLKEHSKALLEMANTKRIEKSSRVSANLSKKIVEIVAGYKQEHGNKKPSLNKIAAILKKENVATPGGSDNWAAVMVKRIVERNNLEL